MSDVQKLGIGHPITSARERDAIHCAIAPVTAAQTLFAGDKVSLDKDGEAVKEGQWIGVVDPFLTSAIHRGDKFWLFLKPGSITGLRHEWFHPDFPVEATSLPESLQKASRMWIEHWASTIPLDYETIMDGAAEYVRDKEQGGYGEFLCFGGLLEGESVPGEFWHHYEVVTGKPVPEQHRG